MCLGQCVDHFVYYKRGALYGAGGPSAPSALALSVLEIIKPSENIGLLRSARKTDSILVCQAARASTAIDWRDRSSSSMYAGFHNPEGLSHPFPVA